MQDVRRIAPRMQKEIRMRTGTSAQGFAKRALPAVLLAGDGGILRAQPNDETFHDGAAGPIPRIDAHAISSFAIRAAFRF